MWTFVIVSVCFMLVGFVYLYTSLTSRMESVERRTDEMIEVAKRHGLLTDQQQRHTQGLIIEIDDKAKLATEKAAKQVTQEIKDAATDIAKQVAEQTTVATAAKLLNDSKLS